MFLWFLTYTFRQIYWKSDCKEICLYGILDFLIFIFRNFYKGNLHTHSNKSDGKLDPKEVCLRYKNAGYDFISLTDHLIGKYDYPIVDTSNYRDESFTTLIGAELHTGAMSNGELWHMVAVGLPLDFSPPNVWDFNFVEGMETANEAD